MKNLINEIKWFIQRGRRGYSDQDVWSFDYYLTDVISGGLRHLAKHHYGYPSKLTDKKWVKILNSIADDLSKPYIANEDVDLPHDEWKKNLEEANKVQQKALKLFIKHFNNYWD